MIKSDTGRVSVDGFIPAGVYISFSRPGPHSKDTTDGVKQINNIHF